MKILQRYVLRETLYPAVMALLVLTFLLIARTAFTESDDVGGALSFGASMRLLACVMPTLCVLTVPMALLIGVLLGMGRLAVDSEIKSFRTHGVNLFTTFFPVIGVGMLVSVMMLYNSLYFAPQMMYRGLKLVDELVFEAANALEPGRFEDRLAVQGAGAVLYFKERDADGAMRNIYLCIEGTGDVAFPEDDEENGVASGDGIAAPLVEDGGITPSEADPDAAAALMQTRAMDVARRERSRARDTGESLVKTLLLARKGRILTDAERKRVTLTLEDGSVHAMRNRHDAKYSIIRFDSLRRDLELEADTSLSSGDIKKMTVGWTLGEMNGEMRELREEAAEETGKDREEALEDLHYLRGRKYWRMSVSLSSLAFVLIGVPLAIYIRPSGKSIGVSIAFGLVMVYYGFLYAGEQMTRDGLLLGPVLTFLPCVLLVGLGAYLMHRVVHR